ncbi:hypothetical protein H9L13_07540 [Sphingomonas lutea]|uniref:Uncharacterized protein n=1 Tax=Sphingomonas lutea TaxID=1045317 RepID=A0A7G9SFE0_9SPHN|nr:hypothetical protein [Sphingomonas lutea]QNN66565.1 hypothetical protein H9L13_07540 [Sphingomonas lutea]
MRLNLRPAKGWRAFAGEVGVIVLGVVIALAAQEAVEAVNERREAAETRATLTAEIRESLAVLELRRAAQPCIDRRLGELRAIVNDWGRTGTFTTPRWVSQATWFAFDTARFEAAQSAGQLALLPSEEQYRFGFITTNLQTFRDIQQREADAWAQLRMLQSGPDVLSASDRTAVRVALQEAAMLNHFAQIRVGQTLPEAAAFGWRPDMRRVRQRMGLAYKGGRFHPSVCIGINTPADQAHREAGLIYELPE